MKTSIVKTQITPETKISVLLDEFPELQADLEDLVPEFKKLRNPILRKTIARITTLRQAASIGKLPLAELINTLRSSVGAKAHFKNEVGNESENDKAPAWFTPERIVKTLDARPMLEKGEHPVQTVLQECRLLKSGEIFELITPFLPAPLMDKAREQGCYTWSMENNRGVVNTYFINPDLSLSIQKK
jgi:uncharacterized protein (DUF2249 family)